MINILPNELPPTIFVVLFKYLYLSKEKMFE